MNIKRQLFSIYTSTVFSGLRVTDAIWVALLAARGYSLWQIGFVEAMFHIVSLLFEIPSGMAADILGRKRTIVCGGVMVTAYNLLMAFAPNFGAVCLAMALNALSNTMFSGTTSALAYDSFRQAGREEDYLPFCANNTQLGALASALGSLASLLEKWVSFTGYYLAGAAAEGISMLANLLLTEPVVTDAQAARQMCFRALPARFVKQARDSAASLRQNPLAVRLIAADAVICVPTYLTTMFLQERLVELGLPTAWLFLPHLVGGAAAMLGTEIGRRLCPRSTRRFYAACALVCGTGALLVGAAPAAAAIFGSALVKGPLEVWLLHSDKFLNDAIPSDQRATLISVDGMAYSLLMIPASPLVGWIGDLAGQAGAGLCVLGACVAASAAWAWREK